MIVQNKSRQLIHFAAVSAKTANAILIPLLRAMSTLKSSSNHCTALLNFVQTVFAMSHARHTVQDRFHQQVPQNCPLTVG